MEALDTSITTPTFSLHNYVSDKLQQILLPWPLSLLHLLPDWIVLSGLMLIILLLIKTFIDPMMAICHLIRDSSLSLTEKVSSVIVPISTEARRRRQIASESERRTNSDLEARVSDLEARLNNFQAQIIRNMGRNQDLPV